MPTTSPENMPDPQCMEIPFSVPGRDTCSVYVTVEPDTDPKLHGQDLIGIWDDPNNVKGFPVIRATVSSPRSRTYASIYGWVQITYTPGESWVMDLYPPFQDVNSPFIFWGSEPTLVDAPGRQHLKNYDWTARSFLCYSPDACTTKDVVPIVAFEWGFWIADSMPYVKRLKQLDVSAWNEHLELFRGSFKGWRFDDVSKT